MFLLLASKEGLLNSLVDVFLGNVKGHGIPVLVTNNTFSPSGVNMIDKSALAAIRDLGKNDQFHSIPQLKVYPYREIENNLSYVELPDKSVWKNKQTDVPPFIGWAVNADDPLYQSKSSNTAFPLEIVINQSLFNSYFDYDKYRETLKQRLPESLFNTIPEKSPKNSVPTTLWLKLKFGLGREELFPFSVIPVERIQAVQKLAFLFPLSTYQALKASVDYPKLRYFPESEETRIKQIAIKIDDNHKSDLYRRFALTVNGELSEYRGDLLVSFNFPMRKSWIDEYAKDYHFRYDEVNTIKGDQIDFSDGYLILPCGRLTTERLRTMNIDDCQSDPTQPVRLDITAEGQGFRHAQVYVSDRTHLKTAVESLVTMKEKALRLHPSYQDALNRFSFLSAMLEVMERPFMIYFVAFLLCALGVQLGILIGHRRHRYGVFIAKGMMYLQVYAMLMIQISLSLLIGFLCAFLIITGFRFYLTAKIFPVARDYSDTLNIASYDFLPLSFSDYAISLIGIVIFAWALAIVILFFLPLRKNSSPALLLHH